MFATYKNASRELFESPYICTYNFNIERTAEMQNDQTAKNIELVKTYFNYIQTDDLETLGSLVAKDIA